MKKTIALRDRIAPWVVMFLLLGMSQQVFAVLGGGGGVGGGTEAIDKLTGFIKAAGVLLILLITVTGFIWIGYSALAKFNEARKGNAEWAEVGLLAVVSVGVLVFLGYLLDQASTLIA
jgi:integrating conjugative element membrane protein (TIGR03745 family)